MRCFDSWFETVSNEIVKVTQTESPQDVKEQPALQKKLYDQVHLHGLGDLNPVLELSNSLLRSVPHVPTTFVESGWVISEVLGEELLLKRGEVIIKAPRKHDFLTYDLDSKSASIKRKRCMPAVMPDWDRIVSAFGWPSVGDARIYLPTVRDSETVEKVIKGLDSTGLRWHMKTTRREKVVRPDSVVLYVDRADVDEAVANIRSAVPTENAKIPGFSLPLNETWTIGIGAVSPRAPQVSYGWSFAAEIAKTLQELADRPLSAEEKVNLSLERLIDKSQRGQIDVKLSW